MRRASIVLSLLLLVGGATTAMAPAASASSAADACGLVGLVVPPAEDDCRATAAFVGDTIDRQADNVFYVFCTVFPRHPACV
ncbi:MAG TPA: hypothetical protein VEU29_03115 [Actinomycetota bacterium]|nr:hypothetical protein [Actinomycetota bacterium]